MAPKRPVISTASKVTSSSVLSSGQQSKLIVSPSSLPQSTMVKDLQDMMGDVILQIRGEMKEILEENNKTLKQEIVLTLKGVASVLEKLNSRVEEVVEKLELMEEKFESMEKEMKNYQDEILMLQYKRMEYALRIRGLHESVQGDLREMVAKDFAVILNREEEEILSGIDQTFRVNSVVAEQKNLPRDVVIYFGKKSLRNEIIQAFYKKRFQIASQDVIILKEIPPKILRRRKEFAFLADELKKRQILFRWDVPTGMVVSYLGIRYSLNTVSKAKDFYTSVLGVCSSSPTMFKVLEDKKVELQFEGPQQVEMEKQKTTCATYNCKEKDQQKNFKEVPQLLVPESEGEVSINFLEQPLMPELQFEESILIKNRRPQQVEMNDQKITYARYNCKEKNQQKKLKEVSQEMKDQKTTCPTYKCKEKEVEEVSQVLVPETGMYECKEKATYKRKEKDRQVKEVEEVSKVLVPELVGEPRLTNFLERSSRADFYAFFSMLASKRD